MASGLVKGLAEFCISFRCACTVHWATSLRKLATWPAGMEFSTNHFCFRTFGVDVVTFRRSSLSNQLENVVFNFTIVQSHCLTFIFIQITIFVISKESSRFFKMQLLRTKRLQRFKVSKQFLATEFSLTQKRHRSPYAHFSLATNTDATLPTK